MIAKIIVPNMNPNNVDRKFSIVCLVTVIPIIAKNNIQLGLIILGNRLLTNIEIMIMTVIRVL